MDKIENLTTIITISIQLDTLEITEKISSELHGGEAVNSLNVQ